MKYWVGVVSEEHVKRGVKGKYVQVCHGKEKPLNRMEKGDWFIYYSPRTEMKGGEPCKSFTAIGKVLDEAAYQVEMFPDFKPFRRNVEFSECKKVPVSSLTSKLELTKNTHWGMLLRSGHFSITEGDFDLIASSMLGRSPLDKSVSGTERPESGPSKKVAVSLEGATPKRSSLPAGKRERGGETSSEERPAKSAKRAGVGSR